MEYLPAVDITTLPHETLLGLCTQALQNWERLEKESLRFYHTDGTFEILASPEEVIERRVECAQHILDLEAALASSRQCEHDASFREYAASEQMQKCHEILDQIGAPRNQDNGLNYHLNGRLSRLIRNETGKLWAAQMEHLEAERDQIAIALRRTLDNFEALLAGKSVRDAEETISEASTALAALNL